MADCILTCKCGATCAGTVVENSPDINAFIAEPARNSEWEGGDANCSHDDFEAEDTGDDDLSDYDRSA